MDLEYLSDAGSFGPLATLFPKEPTMQLGPGHPDLEQAKKIRHVATAVGLGEVSAQCCLSAIWLMNDFLDESHSISQQIETSDGSYLHGIMHRREGDFSNSRYWLRKVSPSNASDVIRRRLEQVDSTLCREFAEELDPARIVELVESESGSGSDLEQELKTLTFWELFGIFEANFQESDSMKNLEGQI